jgi:hypothetical protein
MRGLCDARRQGDDVTKLTLDMEHQGCQAAVANYGYAGTRPNDAGYNILVSCDGSRVAEARVAQGTDRDAAERQPHGGQSLLRVGQKDEKWSRSCRLAEGRRGERRCAVSEGACRHDLLLDTSMFLDPIPHFDNYTSKNSSVDVFFAMDKIQSTSLL